MVIKQFHFNTDASTLSILPNAAIGKKHRLFHSIDIWSASCAGHPVLKFALAMNVANMSRK